jgi:hypothetical protein
LRTQASYQKENHPFFAGLFSPPPAQITLFYCPGIVGLRMDLSVRPKSIESQAAAFLFCGKAFID